VSLWHLFQLKHVKGENMNVTNTKIDRVLEAFKSGEELTGNQIRARFGVANPRATVSDLRMKGYPIYCNERKTTKGITHKYRLGTPSREVIAAGYQYLALLRQSA
jgi:hypothetical protein